MMLSHCPPPPSHFAASPPLLVDRAWGGGCSAQWARWGSACFLPASCTSLRLPSGWSKLIVIYNTGSLYQSITFFRWKWFHATCPLYQYVIHKQSSICHLSSVSCSIPGTSSPVVVYLDHLQYLIASFAFLQMLCDPAINIPTNIKSWRQLVWLWGAQALQTDMLQTLSFGGICKAAWTCQTVCRLWNLKRNVQRTHLA